MKFKSAMLIVAIACGTQVSSLYGDQPNEVRLVSLCDCGQPVCGCEPFDAPCCDSACTQGCDSCSDSDCDHDCGLLGGFFGSRGGCDSSCDSCCDSSGCSIGGCNECCLGDPYTLFDEHGGWNAGGWIQLGYTSKELPAFNTYADTVQLQQAWLWAEKAIDTSCGFDIGGRIDYIYGTDGPNTQAFGTDPRGWDNHWDNGGQYGHAIPQLYVEAGYGDLSVKAGHFYTIIGYEVVPATGNFFYSHSYTFNYSEPFTHTGVLAEYQASENVTVWGGYSLGNDSGFDNNGDTFLGGISLGLTEDLTLTYATNAGRFIEPWSGATFGPQVIKGYQHSIVADYDVSDSLTYIFQSDVLDGDFGDGTNARNTVGVNQYLFKTINDCWGLGARFEWWKVQDALAPSQNLYALTLGVNHRPHANVIVRPEIRWDWDNDGFGALENGDDQQTTFGIDTIMTF